MTKFIIQNGQLMLQREGNLILPKADEIYRSVIENIQVWNDVIPGKSSAPKEITFSRYPVSAKIVIELGMKNSIPEIHIAYFLNDKRLSKCLSYSVDVEHIIADHVWYPIELSSVSEVNEILTNNSLTLGEVSSLKKFIELRRAATDNYFIEDTMSVDNISALSFVHNKKISPDNILAELYPYQIDGWNWLRFIVKENVGGLLADEMGLGKTLQIISVISDPGNTELTPVLIVCPGSLLENWFREIKRFSPKISVLKHHGPFRTGKPQDLIEFDVIITTYESIVRDNSIMLMVDWGMIVIDEAQNIKNPNAKRTIALKRLNRKVAIAVTGTPIENCLTDIWSILDFVVPGYLGSKSDFENKFINDQDGGALLEPFISPIMLRRKILNVAEDLPERIDIPQAILLEPDEMSDYEAIRKNIYEQYGKEATLVALSTLRIFCSHPSLVNDYDCNLKSYNSNIGLFSKFQRFDEIIAEIISYEDKVIVFTSYTNMSDIIKNHINQKYNIFSGCLDGRLPIDDRQPLIDKFSNITGAAVLILNPRAGGSGLNITAANHVIHYNLEWNPALEDQASARAYRRGQTKPVTVHRLFIADTVEEVINERLNRKRELTDSAIVGVTGLDEDYNDIVAALQRTPISNLNKG